MISLKDIKNNILKKENFYFLTIILITFFLDRFSKIFVLDNFSEETFFVNRFLNIDLVWNTGIGFGFFSTDSEILYMMISLLIFLVIIFLIYLSFSSSKIDKLVFSFIIGGALGNFYDRINLMAVPDFIDLHYNSFHWFTFNVADIFITLGILTYLTLEFFMKRDK